MFRYWVLPRYRSTVPRTVINLRNVDSLGIDQPRWAELTSMEEIDAFIEKVGFPIFDPSVLRIVRAAMNVCHTKEQMIEFVDLAAKVSKEYPVVVSEFMQGTKEIEFDAVAMNGEVG